MKHRPAITLPAPRFVPGSGSRMVVAVSGGQDSMALLHWLHEQSDRHGWKLSVAHFNHRLRGRASDADERFVQASARKLQLPCDVAGADVRAFATRRGLSVEMAARELRHAFLARCARRRGAQFIALAHHADDQVELFFLRLLRGAGGEGLAGMKTISSSPADPRTRLWRPLLEIPRATLAAWAEQRGIPHREDTSNRSTDMLRNWVRRELLPAMLRRQPGLTDTVRRTMELTGAEADCVAQLAAAWRPEQTPFAVLHAAVQRRVLQSALHRLHVEPDFALIESLRRADGRAISAGPGRWLSCDDRGNVRRVRPRRLTFRADEAALLVPTSGTGQFTFAGGVLDWRVRRRPAALKLTGGQREIFDADKVGPLLRVRHWRAGDRYQPLGLTRATKLQDWFTNRKIPAARRRQLVLAVNHAGEIFWVEGQRISEAAKVTPATRRILEWRWQPAA